MTASKHRKHLVRARMARTGESYTAARRHVVSMAGPTRLVPAFDIAAHGRHGQAVAYTPDGSVLLSTGQDTAVRAWDPRDGTALFALEGHTKVVNDVVVTDDVAVSASSDRTVRVWDLRSRAPRAVLEGHRAAVVTLAVAGGAVVVSGGYDGRLCWWTVGDGQPQSSSAAAGHGAVASARSTLARVTSLAVTPAAEHLLVAGGTPEVVVHDLATGEVVRSVGTGSDAVTALAVAPDGDVVATATWDGVVTLWAAPAWEPLRRIAAGARVSALDISPDGRLLTAAWDHHVGVWRLDADTPAVTADLPIRGVYGVAFAPDGRSIAQTGADGRVRCWRLAP